MNIETGDYFVVIKGINIDVSFANAIFGIPDNKETGPHYDRSHNGRVFKALEVCGPVIAAKIVHSTKVGESQLGKTISLHTDEIEVWPLTKAYLTALGVKHDDITGHHGEPDSQQAVV